MAAAVFALCVLLLALGAHGQSTYQANNPWFIVDRAPTTGSAASKLTDPICTAIYTVNLRPEYTTQGNDIGMLQPHGKNTSGFGYQFSANWVGVNLATVGADYTNQPFANDTQKQADAKAMFSVTALTEASGTPIGFKSDVLKMYYSVCVYIQGVNNRWVEIMAESPQPDRKICVTDWQSSTSTHIDMNANPYQTACGLGHMYSCRSSPNTNSGSNTDSMAVRFYCDSCDDESFAFYWRIVASQLPPLTSNNNAQPDAEEWCMARKATDYPSTLLQPYPQDYSPPPVFEVTTSSAMSLAVSVWVLVALALLSLFL